MAFTNDPVGQRAREAYEATFAATTERERQLAALANAIREHERATWSTQGSGAADRMLAVSADAPAWLVRAARSLAEFYRIPVYPCAGACGRFAFVTPGTRCYWCRRGESRSESRS